MGEAATSMRHLQAEGCVFDLVLIDADKASSAVYYELVLGLTKEGSLVVMDNVVRGGGVADEELANTDASVRGVREWLASVQGDGRVVGTAIRRPWQATTRGTTDSLSCASLQRQRSISCTSMYHRQGREGGRKTDGCVLRAWL